MVRHLIPLDEGGNRYVEQCRGKLTNDPNATEADEDAAFVALVEKIQAEKAARLALLAQQDAAQEAQEAVAQALQEEEED